MNNMKRTRSVSPPPADVAFLLLRKVLPPLQTQAQTQTQLARRFNFVNADIPRDHGEGNSPARIIKRSARQGHVICTSASRCRATRFNPIPAVALRMQGISRTRAAGEVKIEPEAEAKQITA